MFNLATLDVFLSLFTSLSLTGNLCRKCMHVGAILSIASTCIRLNTIHLHVFLIRISSDRLIHITQNWNKTLTSKFDTFFPSLQANGAS